MRVEETGEPAAEAQADPEITVVNNPAPEPTPEAERLPTRGEIVATAAAENAVRRHSAELLETMRLGERLETMETALIPVGEIPALRGEIQENNGLLRQLIDLLTAEEVNPENGETETVIETPATAKTRHNLWEVFR